jgi:predicted membrane-bound spermidine synthase
MKWNVNMSQQKTHGIFLLCLVVLVEGYVTISAEILFIRQLLAFVGGSIIVTSLIIGVFLLFMAAGYHRGGQIKRNFSGTLQRNLNVASVLFGIGISYPFVELIYIACVKFLHTGFVGYLSIYLLLITAPLVFLLAYTVPIIMDMLKVNQSAGTLGGKMFALSTIGSFLGATLTSLVFLHYFGVAWSIMVSSSLLALLALCLSSRGYTFVFQLIFSLVVIGCVYIVNVNFEMNNFDFTDNYANYQSATINGTHHFYINNANSSILKKNLMPYPYAQLIQKILFSKGGREFRHKNIIVLGAGGFTLTARGDHDNNVTYIDIDPDIKKVVEKHFLKKVKGRFIADDARVFLLRSNKKYDAIVSDDYNQISSLPAYLMTANYFVLLRNHLVNGGLAIFNIIANPSLNNPFARRVDHTIRSVFSSCMVQPMSYSTKGTTNVVYTCTKTPNTGKRPVIYTDNLNTVTFDLFKNVH